MDGRHADDGGKPEEGQTKFALAGWAVGQAELDSRSIELHVVFKLLVINRLCLHVPWYNAPLLVDLPATSLARNSYALLLGCDSFCPSILHQQLLLELRNPLTLLPVAILRAIPMNLLAVAAAVTVRIASLAELAARAIQWSAAYLAALS